MSDWLYPLSSKPNPLTGEANYWFEMSDGAATPDTSPSSLAAIIKDSPGQGPWIVHMNRVNGKVKPKDRIWFYYGRADKDLGVVAVGTVICMDPDVGVSFKWLKGASKLLMSKPVPASAVRQYVQRPRTALWNLDRHPRLVKLLMSEAAL